MWGSPLSRYADRFTRHTSGNIFLLKRSVAIWHRDIFFGKIGFSGGDITEKMLLQRQPDLLRGMEYELFLQKMLEVHPISPPYIYFAI